MIIIEEAGDRIENFPAGAANVVFALYNGHHYIAKNRYGAKTNENQTISVHTMLKTILDILAQKSYIVDKDDLLKSEKCVKKITIEVEVKVK